MMVTVPIYALMISLVVAFAIGFAVLAMTRSRERYAWAFFGPYVRLRSEAKPDATDPTIRQVMASPDYLIRLRATGDDRERAAAAVTEAYTTGRLDTDEHEARLSAVWRAGTLGDLVPLTADLPMRPAHAETAPH